MVSIGSKAIYGYDPRTGEEIWRVVERGSHSASTRPVSGHGLVFVPMGFDAAQLLAVRPDGKGDVASLARRVALRQGRAEQAVDSAGRRPDLHGQRRRDRRRAVEAKTGEMVWRGRVDGTYSASPIVRWRADLRVQRGWQDDRARGGPGVQGAGRELSRGRLHGVAGGRRPRALSADSHARLSHRRARYSPLRATTGSSRMARRAGK